MAFSFELIVQSVLILVSAVVFQNVSSLTFERTLNLVNFLFVFLQGLKERLYVSLYLTKRSSYSHFVILKYPQISSAAIVFNTRKFSKATKKKPALACLIHNIYIWF
jgi:hypothetical protein